MARSWPYEEEEMRFFSTYLEHLERWRNELVDGTVTSADIRVQARRVADRLRQLTEPLGGEAREQLFLLLVEFAVLSMLQWAFLLQEVEDTTSKPEMRK